MPRSQGIRKLLRLLLEEKAGLTLEQLAPRLSVHTRTVKRYLNEVRRQGYDVHSFSLGGRKTAYALGERHRFKEQLVPGLQAIRLELHSWGNPKFTASLQKVIEWIQSLDETRYPDTGTNLEVPGEHPGVYYINHGPFSQEAVPDGTLRILEKAITERRVVCLNYRREKPAPEALLFHPYKLALRVGVLYLLGFEPRRKRIESLQVQRIQRLVSTGKTFSPRPFSPESFYKYCFGGFGRQPGEKPVAVSLWVRSPWAEAYLKTSHFNPPGQWAAEGDELFFRVSLVIRPDFIHWVAGLMPDVIPTGPPSLVREVRERVEKSMDILKAKN